MPHRWSTSLDVPTPFFNETRGVATTDAAVSDSCRSALRHLLTDSPSALSVANEASSHPSAGLTAVRAQPWLYAGGGLGNPDECTAAGNGDDDYSSCLAGGRGLYIGRICIPTACQAHDLVANDMWNVLQDGSVDATSREYATAVERLLQMNRFLQTGWTCGEWRMDWELPAVLYTGAATLWVLLVLYASSTRRRRPPTNTRPTTTSTTMETQHLLLTSTKTQSNKNDDESPPSAATSSVSSEDELDVRSLSDDMLPSFSPLPMADSDTAFHWMDALDARLNWQALWVRPGATSNSSWFSTACLDGLRVGSMLWIVLGHVMAIVSSAGAGYSNPAAFLPPSGWTTTTTGQLLFASRFAVDTFFVLSGFLLVHVLLCKEVKIVSLPLVIVSRVFRILPLYATTLFFYMLVAPHLNSGPFWYQWIGLLQPCVSGWWLNLSFVQNLGDTTVTDTCFYHSWYLAVDMQLFCAFVCLVVVLRRLTRNAAYVQVTLVACLVLSIVITIYGTATRHWSLHTFDGAAVVRYDEEAYAQPFVRAQSYLMGMILAAYMNTRRAVGVSRRFKVIGLSFAVACMLALTFGTVFGAYNQRPCQSTEWPSANVCGSTWSTTANFLYTAFGRTFWCTSVLILIFICCVEHHEARVIERPGAFVGASMINAVLTWSGWVPLSHLNFAVYLIHPIVIFVWQLGDSDKAAFSLISFFGNYVFVCVASYGCALVGTLVVELPFATLWKQTRKNYAPATPISTPRQLAMLYGSTSDRAMS